MTATRLEPGTTKFVNKHSTIWPDWPNDWAAFWVLIYTVHLTVCYSHVKYAFQSESTLYSWLIVKEILPQSRREIWTLSDCNWIWTHDYLVRKRTLNHGVPWSMSSLTTQPRSSLTIRHWFDKNIQSNVPYR